MQTALTTENKTSQTLEPRVLRALRPAADVLEGKDQFLLTLDMPGVTPEALEVSVENKTLSIQGTRFLAAAEEGKARPAVRYQREFALPDTVNLEAIEARLESGVLTLALPKSQAARARRIEVKV
jgi:HSP20 family protein